MDEMIIKSDFSKMIIGKLLEKVLRNSLGETDVKVKDIHVTIDDNDARIHLNVDAKMKKTELLKLVVK